jgi:hypothetical protein
VNWRLSHRPSPVATARKPRIHDPSRSGVACAWSRSTSPTRPPRGRRRDRNPAFGRLDVVEQCRLRQYQLIEDMADDDFHAQFDTNFLAS